jgi:hypothetical protein
MKALINSGILLILLFLISCKNEESKIDQSDTIRFRYYNLENAGWKSRQHSQKVENIIFTATEVPIQYYLLKDKGNENLNAVDSIYEKNKKERIIEFTFQDENEDDLLKEKYTKIDYESSVKYMSFFIDKDYYVVTSKNDTIKCSGVTFERSFKITPYNKVLLFFSNINPNEKIQLVYQDNLFRKGTLKFRFKEPIINL